MTVSPADIEYGLSLLKGRQTRDLKYARYYGGSFDMAFASHSFRQAFGSFLKNIGYNRCRSVVDAFADRTTVTGWDIPGAPDALVKAANDLWLRTKFDQRQHEVIREAYRTGDGYVVVWPDENGLARFYTNYAHTMTVVYDDEYPDQLAYAVKCWQVDRGADKGKWRVTVYDAEVIARYITTATTDEYPEKTEKLTPYTDDGQPETANPYGIVPVVHFGNDADTGGFGTSELADVVPLQDGANKALADMLVASEFVAYPQRYVIGVDEPEKDPMTGQPINPFIPGMNRLWTTAGSTDRDQPVQFGEFAAADMAQFVTVQDSWDDKIARVSRVPVSWLNQSGSNVSGETKKMDESPFVSKVVDRQGSFTSPWGDVESIGMIMEGASPDEVAALKPIWMPAESRSDIEKYTVAQAQKTIGIPDEMIWTGLGFSPDEIAEMRALKDAAAAKAQAQFASAFDRTPPGNPNDPNNPDNQQQQPAA